jgi:hypothetical protein
MTADEEVLNYQYNYLLFFIICVVVLKKISSMQKLLNGNLLRSCKYSIQL